MTDQIVNKSLRELGLEQWRACCRHLSVSNFEDGASIYQQGVHSEAIYYLASGYVKISMVSTEGVERTIGIINSGELFGPGISTAAIENPATETANAKGAVNVYQFPRQDLIALVNSSPAYAEAVFDVMLRRYSILMRQLGSLHFKNARARIAEILLDLVHNYGGVCNHGHQVDIPLTQQELADIAGISRPVASTILNQLREEALLSYTRNYICIDDMDALFQVAEHA